VAFTCDTGDKCFMWTTLDQLTGVAITDAQYDEECGWMLLNKLLQDFRDHFSASPGDYENAYQDMDEYSLPYPNIEQIYAMGQNPEASYGLKAFQQDLEEIRKTQVVSI
jgi:hypothetical protein